jgi:hypothetical protein
MSCSGSHLGITINIKDTKFVKDLPMIDAQGEQVSFCPGVEPEYVSQIDRQHNGQNCSILNQNVPKFELYKHNDELFNIYYRIFYASYSTGLLQDTAITCSSSKAKYQAKPKNSPHSNPEPSKTQALRP